MEKPPRVALFIDAENVAPSNATESLEIARSLGALRIARCFGNEAALIGWKSAIAEHHLVPHLTPAHAGKPNASDFAITIEAVSLLHADRFDVALIASSDSDFGLLALHIREHGKAVCCLADGKKLKSAMRAPYDKVFELTATSQVITTAPAPQSAAKKPAAVGIQITPIPTSRVDKLKEKFTELQANQGTVTLAAFGNILAKSMPKDYYKGHRNFSVYLKNTGAFLISEDHAVTLKTP